MNVRGVAALGGDAPRPALIALGATAVFVVVVALSLPSEPQLHEAVSNFAVTVAAGVSAFIILQQARKPGAWEGMLYFGIAMLVLMTAKFIDTVLNIFGNDVNAADVTDVLFLLIGAICIFPARVQFRDHFAQRDRSEISADVALIAISMISVVYLLIRPSPGEATAAFIWSALFAATAAIAFTSYVALTLWIPSPAHMGQLAVVAVFSIEALAIGSLWVRGEAAWGAPLINVPVSLAALGLATLMLIRPEDEPHKVTTAGWGRPVLTALSVAVAAGSLGVIASLQVRGAASGNEAAILIMVLGGAIAGRILLNQVRSAQDTEATEKALAEREFALRETDQALARLQDALGDAASSEERMRLLFDAAVDGIVELDSNDVVRTANDAFCEMVGLEREFLIGKPWDRVAAAAPGGASIASLLVNGQAALDKGGHELFLEARTSEIPGDPPSKLLLARDVTSAKVADQTIRSLFQFLQDRDEDRTRLMKRTNAAIEAERNRVARDLHDGPVQGVSAASLSLEATALMLKAGDMDEAIDTLGKVREQLSEEADNLRRLMSNLRPPLLEERGLVPALQETLARFGNENRLETKFRGRALVDVPTDLETLAYRLVQEALTNTGKHAHATEVGVAVDAVAGQLKVEITDNGVGFDPGMARDFLRAGKVGLASMRERIELANGTFGIQSAPNNGTTISASLPMDSVPSGRE